MTLSIGDTCLVKSGTFKGAIVTVRKVYTEQFANMKAPAEYAYVTFLAGNSRDIQATKLKKIEE